MMEKIAMTCHKLQTYMVKNLCDIEERYYRETGYKRNNEPPKEGWLSFPQETSLSGKERHYWIKLKFKTPDISKGKSFFLNVSTGFEGRDNTLNPQGMVFADGNLLQALDTNHSQVKLEPNRDYEMFIYLYNGSVDREYSFKTCLVEIDEQTEQLYYDIFVPMLACDKVYTKNSFEYANIIKILNAACNMLQLNYGYSQRFGLVYVDYNNLRRIPKDSFYWYKSLIEKGEISN